VRLPWPFGRARSRILWLDLGDLGALVTGLEPHEKWQDHGLGLLRTILHKNELTTELLSTRTVTSWGQVGEKLRGYEMLLMNVRSYTFPLARTAARMFKEVNPTGRVLTGGLHASVALEEMKAVQEFDKICLGPGENIIVDLVRDPSAFPRVFPGNGAKSMAEWPIIDRSLWPKPPDRKLSRELMWPLESECGWGPGPVATVLTSRTCPWQCAFCNEGSYIRSMGRRPVDAVIEELNGLDEKYAVGSVVIHDSMFFQNPRWLHEWLEKYPSRANRAWPYWAAARADTVRRWPDLFEALLKETNWANISIGFESGSNRMLRLLGKGCSEEDNDFTIDLVNRVGDEMELQGKAPPSFWANIILAIPGETREDAFKTMRMVKRMRRARPSIACCAPYPGSALGHQLIAEGKSLISQDDYHRFFGEEKIKGIDYQFYRDLLSGKYDDEIDRGAGQTEQQPVGPPSDGSPRTHDRDRLGGRHHMYVFSMKNGRKKLAYGESPADALDILSIRLTGKEMEEIVRSDHVKISQTEMQNYVHLL